MLDDDWRSRVHQAWTHGQVLLIDYDGRLTLAVPGTTFTADRALEAIGRLAKAVGVSPAASWRRSALTGVAQASRRSQQVVEDLADPAPERQVTLVLVEVHGRAGHVGGEPLPCANGTIRSWRALPDRHRHRDVRRGRSPRAG